MLCERYDVSRMHLEGMIPIMVVIESRVSLTVLLKCEASMGILEHSEPKRIRLILEDRFWKSLCSQLSFPKDLYNGGQAT